MNFEYKEKNVSLETDVTKSFLVSLQLLCLYGYLREKKTIEQMRYVHEIGEKKHIETLLVLESIWLSTILAIQLVHISERIHNLNYNMFTGARVFMSEAIHTICTIKFVICYLLFVFTCRNKTEPRRYHLWWYRNNQGTKQKHHDECIAFL